MIRVLCVDDSALVREILTKHLSQYPGIEVVGTAPNPYIARDKIVELHPDVLTLDIEMPRMDGVEFLRKLIPQYPIPVVVLSSLTPKGGDITLQALEAGAVDFMTKPSMGVAGGLALMMDELADKIRAAARVPKSMLSSKTWMASRTQTTPKSQGLSSKVLSGSTDKVIALGASTGGTEALRQILEECPPGMPGMVVVQHFPPGITAKFAERLDALTPLHVREAQDGDRVLQGHVLIAPGGKHLKVQRSGGTYVVRVFDGPKVNSHIPSVELLFDSVSEQVGHNALGILLTGMGRDGSEALLRLRQTGAHTIAQDEASSVVWGMPGEAVKIGAAKAVLALNQVAKAIVTWSKQVSA